jgi:hypothetical protein
MMNHSLEIAQYLNRVDERFKYKFQDDLMSDGIRFAVENEFGHRLEGFIYRSPSNVMLEEFTKSIKSAKQKLFEADHDKYKEQILKQCARHMLAI